MHDALGAILTLTVTFPLGLTLGTLRASAYVASRHLYDAINLTLGAIKR